MSEALTGRVPEATAVRLFGGLRLTRDSTPLPTPVGTCAALLRIVATSGAVHVDELTEALWPEAAPGAGRARLRNVLSRLRASCGDVEIRVGETVAVADDVEVDVAVFESTARRALALPEGDPRRQVWAKQALSWCGGELLPEDVYHEWSAAPRERVRHFRLALLDLVADDAAASGDVSGALRRWQEAASIEPYDEGRYVKMARLLIADGRWGAAHTVLERAEAALADLGLTASPALAEIRRRLSDPRGA
jgi:DNA-binding SARP family transcriptional activator